MEEELAAVKKLVQQLEERLSRLETANTRLERLAEALTAQSLRQESLIRELQTEK
ncbi:MAG: hypothetical protein PHC60_04370 [Heliobacteriaceae bacterium]|nr:hypothetical protein [Heliobacteriaceae bacterium]MDD4587614.1 hypothetical protein [Heliobacteriaceae bacterium]